jgi:hypothetical protein
LTADFLSDASFDTRSVIMTDVVNRVRALNQQALALLKSNDLDRADELLLTAHREMAAWDGPKDDPEVIAAKITTLNNQGCSAKRRGKYLKAVSCFETAMSLERHIGHSVSPITLINLSTALTAMGDMDRACAVAADCLAMIPKADGPMRVIAMHNLAVARHCSGDRPSGIQLLTKALNIAVTVLGENHSTTQQVRQRLRDWTPAASSAAAGAASARGSRGVAVFAPVPPLTGRAAAVRALRSLDFGTPDLVRPQSKPGLAGHRGSPGGDGHAEGLPSKGQVMAGATFAATPTQSVRRQNVAADCVRITRSACCVAYHAARRTRNFLFAGARLAYWHARSLHCGNAAPEGW